MTALRLVKWSVIALVATTVGLAAQESLQKLYESGNDQAVIDRAGEGRASSPEDTYLAGLAYLRSERRDNGVAEFRRLSESGDEVWRLIGKSAVARLEQNNDEAISAARQATEMAGDNMFAHYQLGLAAGSLTDWNASSLAFDRAAQLRPDFAYAHYNAGLTFQKHGNLGKASEHFNAFLKLAPDSPDRPAVLAIMRALRK